MLEFVVIPLFMRPGSVPGLYVMGVGNRKLVGFVGLPAQAAFERFGGAEFVDLDNAYPGVPPAGADVLPQNTCAIIKRIVANGLAMPLDAILVDEGPGKCDMSRMAAYILENRTNAKVIRATNDNIEGRGTPVCDSTLAPSEKVVRIFDGLVKEVKTDDLEPEPSPPVAVWGVPAADLAFYDLFPPGTRLLGWFRCLENRTPALEKLELEVTPDVPTIFFAQTFCHKNIIARHLANLHGGLYVDADGVVSSSVKAKIEAFLEFNVKVKGS